VNDASVARSAPWLLMAIFLSACGGGGDALPAAPVVTSVPPAPLDIAPKITTTTIPHAVVGTAYSTSLTATAGNGASQWTLSSGTLPAGLSLSSAGVLSGMPAVSGAAVITVRVTDSDTTAGSTDEDSLQLDFIIDSKPLPPGIPASSRAVSIVVIGASTSACKNLVEGGYALADCWVNRFAAYLQTIRPGSTITNLAVSGTGTCHALPSSGPIPALCPVPDPHPIPDAQHNITQALALHPDLVIVNYPGDYALGVNLLIANLQKIQDAATLADVPIWFSTSQPSPSDPGIVALRIEQRNRVTATFAPRVVDFWTSIVDPGNTGMMIPSLVNHYDDAHPNAEGHRLLFEAAKANLAL